MVEHPGKDTQRQIIGARLSNLHFLPPPGVSLVTSEGLGRVEVTLENDDVDPGELSRLTGLHPGPGRCERCLSQIQDLKTVKLLFCPSRGGRVGSGSPSGWMRVPLLQQPHTWSLLFCQKAIEEAMWATPCL